MDKRKRDDLFFKEIEDIKRKVLEISEQSRKERKDNKKLSKESRKSEKEIGDKYLELLKHQQLRIYNLIGIRK